MASLLPSLKEKRRYLVYQVLSETPLHFKDVKEALAKEFTTFLGRLGEAQAGILFLDDWNNNKGIIRMTTSALDYVKAALIHIRKINKTEVVVASVGVSGTLNKARTKFSVH